ncbi:MAG: hypothetical protein J6D04_04700, partial [Clostridia bacterium]|nr:hypothetical protein [Clostridia bacterium]
MKRFVSLILALSMVLALVPVAFAEDTPEKLVYDLGEAFTPATTFGQGMAADYSQLGFTKPEGTAWSVGYYGNQSGYDTFTEFTKLYRNKVYTRAAGDTVNDTLTVTGEGNSPTTPITAMTMSSSAGVSYFNPESTYYNIHASAADVKGDGGYGIDDGNCNEGSVGYSFG